MAAAPFVHEPDALAVRRLVVRLRALTPEQWTRVRTALEPQRGERLDAVWQRSRRRAVVTQTIFPRTRGLVQVVFAAAELIAEFHPPRATRADADRARERFLAQLPAGATRDYFLAEVELRAAIAPHVAGDDLLEEAITSAAHAVAYRETLSAADVHLAYGVLDAVVPLDSVADSERSG